MRSPCLSHQQAGSASGTSGSGLTSSTVCGDGLQQLLDAAKLVAQAGGGKQETPEPEVHSAGITALLVQESSSKSRFFWMPGTLAVTASILDGAALQLPNKGGSFAQLVA